MKLSVMKRAAILFCIALVLSLPLFCFAHHEGTGLSLRSGETLFAGGLTTNVSYELVHFSDHDVRRIDQITTLSVGYGWNENFNIGLQIPFRMVDGRGGDEGDVHNEGIGDILALGKYRLYHGMGSGWDTSISLFGGVRFPTGDSHAKQNGELLDPDLQMGLGTYSFVGGIAAGYEVGNWAFDSYFIYQHHNEGTQNFQHGDEITTGVGASWTLYREKYPGQQASVGLEVFYSYEARDHQYGDLIGDSGGWVLFASPHISYNPRPNTTLSIGMAIPLNQNQKDEPRFDYTVSATVGFVF